MGKEPSEQEKYLLYLFQMKIWILLKSLIDGVTETVTHEIKKARSHILRALLATSTVQPVISSVVKCISGRGVRKIEREFRNNNF